MLTGKHREHERMIEKDETARRSRNLTVLSELSVWLDGVVVVGVVVVCWVEGVLFFVWCSYCKSGIE